MTNYSQHVFATNLFHLTSFDPVANAWSKHMQVHHARLQFKLAPLQIVQINQALQSVLLSQGLAIRQTALKSMFSLFSLPASFTWQASILLPMHEANTCRFITHVCDFNWHYFSLSRLNQSLQSVLLCPRTSYLPNFSQHVFAPNIFDLTSFDLVANAWSKHMQVHHARLRFKLAPL